VQNGGNVTTEKNLMKTSDFIMNGKHGKTTTATK
jgi:hypothetical protein